MLQIQSAVAHERIADMLRVAERDRRICATRVAHEVPTPTRTRRRAIRRWRRSADAASVTSAAR